MSDEFESMLFEAEVILPAQRSWGACCAGDTSGACALMLAILEDAMRCIERRRRRDARTRERAAEAEAWIRSDGREWLFSFASICDVLGFDADALRVRLLVSPEHPASGGPAVRTEVNEPSRHGAAGARLVPQREGTRGSITVANARAPSWRTGSGRETGAGVGVRVHVGVA